MTLCAYDRFELRRNREFPEQWDLFTYADGLPTRLETFVDLRRALAKISDRAYVELVDAAERDDDHRGQLGAVEEAAGRPHA